MLRILLMGAMLLACGDDGYVNDDEEEQYIYTSGNAENRRRLRLNASPDFASMASHVYTESLYADVTASDRVQIVFLVDDSETMSKPRQKLSTALAAMLKQVINSNWSIAVTTLHAQNYPQASITKYEDSFDYEKKFSQAVMDLQQITRTKYDNKESVRAYVIVTDKDLNARYTH